MGFNLGDAIKGAAQGFLTGGPTGAWVGGALGGFSGDPSKQGDRAAQAGIDARTQFLRESRDIALEQARPYTQAGYSALGGQLSMLGLPPVRTPGGPFAAGQGDIYQYTGDWGTDLQNIFATSGELQNFVNQFGTGENVSRAQINQYLNDYIGRLNVSGLGKLPGGDEPGLEGVLARARRGDDKIAGQWDKKHITQLEDLLIANRGNWDKLAAQAAPLGAGGDQYQWQTDPGYQFRLSEGEKALDRKRAAGYGGGLVSGGAMKEAARYSQNFASNEFQNIFNRLGSISKTGQSAATNQANVLMGTAGGIGAGMAASGFQRQSAYDREAEAQGDLFNLGMDVFGGGWSAPSTPQPNVYVGGKKYWGSVPYSTS